MRNFLNSFSSSIALVLVFIVFGLFVASPVMADDDEFFDDELDNEELVLDVPEYNSGIADPIEPLNRIFFTFNDKLYFWVLKPVATGYKAVFADEDVRGCFSNAFHNLLAPVRVVNNLLQGKISGAGNELASFLINSTLGIAGLADPAHHEFGLDSSDEDFGQTLGSYGIGNGFYICWPILGPSSLRDTVGSVGDSFLDPLAYLISEGESAGYVLQGEKQINKASLKLGEYEQFKEASFDPYTALRNAYVQHRNSRINDKVDGAAIDYGAASLDKKKDVKLVQDIEIEQEELIEPEVVVEATPEVTPEVFWDNVGHGFYVLVGVYRDPSNIDQQKSRLAVVGKKVVVARYERDNYSFYGIEVPGGADFVSAKQVEKELLAAGFIETTVVRH